MGFFSILSQLELFIPAAQILSMLFVGFSAIGAFCQLKRMGKLNQLRATQDTIDKVVAGDFSHLRDKLEKKYSCKFIDKNQTYRDVIKTLSVEEKRKLDTCLRKMFNLLEVTTNGMDKKMIHEETCYHIFGSTLRSFYRWGKEYIKDRQAVNATTFVHVVHYANKWEKRAMKEEQIRKEEEERILYHLIHYRRFWRCCRH